MKVRLQKFLADAGIASRRACEGIIVAGRVSVNGTVIQALGSCVDPGQDQVRVDGQLARPRRKLYVALHKPVGYVCSRQAEGQHRLVAELLPREWSNLYPVGRLDRDTEGLLFLTNDGEFCLRLTHPRYEVRKQYVATVAGRVEPIVLHRLQQGVTHGGEQLKANRVRLLSANASQSVIELELSEGKNHEVRRMFASQGFTVTGLHRTQVGPIKLGELPLGKYRVLTAPEVAALLQPSGRRERPGQHPPVRAGRRTGRAPRQPLATTTTDAPEGDVDRTAASASTL